MSTEPRSSSAGPILGLLLLLIIVGGVIAGIIFLRSPGEPSEEPGETVVVTPNVPEPATLPEADIQKLSETTTPESASQPISFTVVCMGAEGADDAPMEGVKIKATPLAGLGVAKDGVVEKTTGTDGSVLFDNLPYRAYLVQATPEGSFPLFVRGVRDGARVPFVFGDSFYVKGQVLDAETDQPVEGAFVQLISQMGGELLRNRLINAAQRGADPESLAGLEQHQPAFRLDLFTGADGTFEFPFAPAGYNFRLTFEHELYDHYEEPIRAEQGDDQDVPSIRLIRRSAIFGKVLDFETGEPLPGVQVVATEGGVPLDMARQTRAADIYESTSDESGEFRLEGISRGRQFVQVDHPGYDTFDASFQFQELEPYELNIELKRGASIAGRVVDPSGRPVEGALVYWLHPGMQILGASIPSTQPRVQTAADGAFSFDGLPVEQPLILVASHASFIESRNRDIVLQAGERLTDFEIILSQGGSITGFVRAGNQPIEGALVTARPTNPSGRPLPPVVSGTDGSFTIGSTSAAMFEVTCEAEGFCPLTLRNVRDIATGVNFNMVRASTLTGRILSRQTGEPVKSFTMRWKTQEDAAGRRVKRKTFHDEEGKFELANMMTGEYSFEIEAENHAPLVVDNLSIPEGQVVEKDLELVMGTTIVGRVAGVNGVGIRSALVRFENLEPFVLSEKTYTKLQTTADVDGNFELPNMLPGRYKAWASHPRYAYAQPMEVIVRDDPEMVVDLTLERPASFHLRVEDENGFPLPGAKVSFFQGASPLENAERIVDPTSGRPGLRLESPAQRHGFINRSDADAGKSNMNMPANDQGELLWQHKEAGEWTLWIGVAGYQKYEERITLIAGKTVTHVATMRPLQEGEDPRAGGRERGNRRGNRGGEAGEGGDGR